MSYRIFIVSYIYDPYVKGDMGGHRKVLELAENLEALGHDVTIFVPHYEKFFDKPGVRITRVYTINIPIIRPVTFGISLFFSFLLKSITGKPDIVYARPIRSFTPLIFSKIMGAFSFYELNGNPYQGMAGKKSIKYLVERIYNHINFRFFDRLIAITPRIKSLLINEHNIPSGKIEVIESSTNEVHFKPADSDIRSKLGISADSCVVGFAGTLFEYQGVQLLIEASKKIIDELKNPVFLIVGDGIMRANLEAFSAQKGFNKYFIFTGQVRYKEVPGYINAMDICVAPLLSNRDEVSPLKLYDYMACGKAVITSNIEPLENLLAEAKCIVTFKPDDASDLAEKIILIAKDKQKRLELGKQSRDYIMNGHTWKDNSKKVIDIFKSAKV